jgi:GxxExxY protein
MNTDIIDKNRIPERVIGCAFIVANTLGAGFLEKIYENALLHEIRKPGFMSSNRSPCPSPMMASMSEHT